MGALGEGSSPPRHIVVSKWCNPNLFCIQISLKTGRDRYKKLQTRRRGLLPSISTGLRVNNNNNKNNNYNSGDVNTHGLVASSSSSSSNNKSTRRVHTSAKAGNSN